MKEIDQFVKECMKKENEETFYAWKKQILINSFQPKRLSPEEHNLCVDLGVIKLQASPISMEYFMLSDSLNSTNK